MRRKLAQKGANKTKQKVAKILQKNLKNNKDDKN